MRAASGFILAFVMLAAAPAAAQPENSDDDELRKQIDELRARQRLLEARLAAEETRRPPEEKSSDARVRFGYGGFVFGTPDGKYELRVRAVLHVDARVYVGDREPIPDTFVLRRARPFIEGTLFGVFDFRLMPNFAYGQATMDDAFIELHPFAWLRLRAGRYRVPIGLEWIQSDCAIHLVERSLATDLVPWRALGVMLSGDIAGGTLRYDVGMFNGAPDFANGPDLDLHSDKDYVGRLFIRPLVRTRASSWTNLGFGVSGSYGLAHGTPLAPSLPTYKSPGQLPIFSYAGSAAIPSSLTLADGARWRVSPQGYWYVGPVGLFAEYVMSSQRVTRLGSSADILNRAWNLTALFVITLEHASFDGVRPRHPVDFRHLAFGALEVVARYSELRLDDQAFPQFADADTSVHGARELAAGLNWYLTDFIKVMASYHATTFTGGAANGASRETENALLFRLQLAL